MQTVGSLCVSHDLDEFVMQMSRFESDLRIIGEEARVHEVKNLGGHKVVVANPFSEMAVPVSDLLQNG
jgi:hypothetical protein